MDTDAIPHWAPPTHAMQILRYAEQGSIELLWIPRRTRVSLPDLARIRRILAPEELLVVVQDLFLTETAAARRRRPAGRHLGEKTGTFTNADRTVHLSEKAVEPPGEARSDLEIFLDYARRMDFRDRDGAPLISWQDPDGAFEAGRHARRVVPATTGAHPTRAARAAGSSGRATRRARRHGAALRRRGVQHRSGRQRDLRPGPRHRAPVSEEEYRAKEPAGRAYLHAADYHPSPEKPSDESRRADHRPDDLPVPHPHEDRPRAELQAAAPEVWGELNAEDAAPRRHGGRPGARQLAAWRDRGASAARRASDAARVCAVSLRLLGCRGAARAERGANELTLTAWDPVSKQPMFKLAAVTRGEKRIGLGCSSGTTSLSCTTPRSGLAGGVPRRRATGHRDEVDVGHTCHRLAEQCEAARRAARAHRRAVRPGRRTPSPGAAALRDLPGAAGRAASGCCATSRTST